MEERKALLGRFRYGNTEKRRQVASENLKFNRKSRRTINFNIQRNILEEDLVQGTKENNLTEQKKNKEFDRKQALQKYKAEKEAMRKNLKEKQRPPFKVGIPHHGFSPILRNLSNFDSGEKTKAAKESQQTKAEFVFTGKKVESTKKLTLPHTPTVLKRSAQKKPALIKALIHSRKMRCRQEPQLEELAAPLETSKDHLNSQDTDAEEYLNFQDTDAEEYLNFQNTNAEEHLNFQNTNAEEHLNFQNTDAEEHLNLQNTNAEELLNFLNTNAEEHLNLQNTNAEEHLNFQNTDAEGAGSLEGGSQTTAIIKSLPSVADPENLMGSKTSIALLTPNGEIADDQVPNEKEGSGCKYSEEVAFHYDRLDSETSHLLTLAELWESISLKEDPPQETVDEIDCIVGQTRLLTADKFQQFRGLIQQYTDKVGTHPITLDDLNGFWDMIYLQVEQLVKRYKQLEYLKDNNWILPNPPPKKKGPGKKRKLHKTTEKLETFKDEVKETKLTTPLVSIADTCDDVDVTITTNGNNQVASVLSNLRQRHSNSPAPFIAMRLSGVCRSIGRSPNPMITLAEPNGTPKSMLPKITKTEPQESESIEEIETRNEEEEILPKKTPRRSVKINIYGEKTPDACSLFASASKKQNRSEILPKQTPRRSVRLNTCGGKTPDEYSPCTSASKKQNRSEIIPKQTPRRSVRLNTHSGKTPDEYSPCTSASKNQNRSETIKTKSDNSKLNTSSRFFLKPSMLLVDGDTNTGVTSRKSKRGRQSSMFTVGETITEYNCGDQLNVVKYNIRRSTRQSKKVTFESSGDEKISFKLPVTPYRKSGFKKGAEESPT